MPCSAGGDAGCEEWRTPDGTVHLSWSGQSRENGPGLVSVELATADTHRRATVLASAGAPETGDPRGLDLPLSVEQLEALVHDPGLALRP